MRGSIEDGLVVCDGGAGKQTPLPVAFILLFLIVFLLLFAVVFQACLICAVREAENGEVLLCLTGQLDRERDGLFVGRRGHGHGFRGHGEEGQVSVENGQLLASETHAVDA